MARRFDIYSLFLLTASAMSWSCQKGVKTETAPAKRTDHTNVTSFGGIEESGRIEESGEVDDIDPVFDRKPKEVAIGLAPFDGSLFHMVASNWDVDPMGNIQPIPDGVEVVGTEQELRVRNVGGTVVNQVMLEDDGRNRYRIGSVATRDLMDDILTGIDWTSPEDKARAVWHWTTSQFQHYCSMGSPALDQMDRFRTLKAIYSYGFGCCSDINQPILSTLLALAGLDVYSVMSPRHVALEVRNESATFHVDADMRVFLPGSVEAKNLPDYQSVLFPDEGLAIYGGVQAAYIGSVESSRLRLFPKDEIAFSKIPIGDELIFTPGLWADGTRPLPSKLEGVPEVFYGDAVVSLPQFYFSSGIENGLQCHDFDFDFPYVLIDAEILNAPAAVTARFRFEKKFLPLETWTPGSIHRLVSGDVDLNGRYGGVLRLCGEGLRVDDTRLHFKFQYNGNLLPKNWPATRSIAKSSLVVRGGSFRTPRASVELKGSCPTDSRSITASVGSFTDDDCSDSTWKLDVPLQEGPNQLVVTAFQADDVASSDKVEITRDSAMVGSPTFDHNGLPDDYLSNTATIALQGTCIAGAAMSLMSPEGPLPKVDCIEGRWSQPYFLKRGVNTFYLFGDDSTGNPVMKVFNVTLASD